MGYGTEQYHQTSGSVQNRRNAFDGGVVETCDEPHDGRRKIAVAATTLRPAVGSLGNQPRRRRRTAPSALNRQEIDLYLIGRKGAYRYDAEAHALVPVAEGDLRGKVNSQGTPAPGLDPDLRGRLHADDAGRHAGQRRHRRYRRRTDRAKRSTCTGLPKGWPWWFTRRSTAKRSPKRSD